MDPDYKDKLSKSIIFPGVVIANNVRIKSSPKKFSKDIFFIKNKLDLGELVFVCDMLMGNDDHMWYYIKLNHFIYGFVRSDYIEVIHKFRF